MNASPGEWSACGEGGVLIRIWIERTQPLAGTAVTTGTNPLRFDGWLELLRVIAELVAAATSKEGEEEQACGP
jgi:hypothetical protein